MLIEGWFLIVQISTVLFFKAAALQMAELHSRLNSTYLYSFDFQGTRTQHHPLLPFPGGKTLILFT